MLERCHTFRFSIHDMIKAQVSGPRWFLQPVVHEFAMHEIKAGSSFDPHVEAVIRQSRAVSSVPSTYKPLFEWKASHLFASWRAMLMEKENGALLLYVSGNRLTRFVLSKWLIEPAIRVAALRKGLVMTHAAALSDGDEALLVSGPGGAGKTTWTLRWLEGGHPYLSDDFSIVAGEQCFPYVTPLRLGLRNLFQSRSLKEMRAGLKIEAAARTVLRRASMGRARLYLKAPLHKAVPAAEVSHPVPVAGALLLNKPEDSGDRASVITPHEFAGLQAQTDLEEMHGFGGDTSLPVAEGGRSFPERQEELLKDLLHDKPCLAVPSNALPPSQAIESVRSLIDVLSRSLR